MAYRDMERSDSNVSMSAMDGVQVKIGDSFLPPRKVTLPLQYETRDPAAILNEEYDFKLEESVLHWYENQRQAKQCYDKAQVDKIGATIEEFTRIGGGAGTDSSDSDISPAIPNGDTVPSGATTTEPKKPPPPLPPPKPDQIFANLGHGILQPTPISMVMKQASGQVKGQVQPNQTSFNIADFEREQDPFDNVTLKVIDDMAELKSVLQPADQLQAHPGPSQHIHGGGSNRSSPLPAAAAAGQAAGGQEASVHLQPAGGAGAGVAHFRPPVPPKPNKAITNNAVDMNQRRTTSSPAFGGPGQTVSTNSIVSGQTHEKLTMHGPPPSYVPAQSVQDNTKKDCKEFQYSNHYSRHADVSTANGLLSNAYSAPYRAADVPSVTPLRNAHSNPDLSKTGEKKAASPYPMSHSPPPRPSSGQDWNPYSPLPPVPPAHKASVSSGGASSSPGSTLEGATSSSPSQQQPPDPYSTMTHQDKRFVDNLTDMGFPRARVARAVQKMGQDDKLVIDHLCSVNRLVERGIQCDQAESALHLFANDETKATDYCELLEQFKVLGFSEKKISEALVMHNNDRDKALDFLTT